MKQGKQRINDLIYGYRKAKILFTAVSLNIFDFTAGNKGKTAGWLSSELKTDKRTTEILLNALTGMGFLKKSGSCYSNTEISDKFLTQGKAGYVGHNLKYQDMIWREWSKLGEIIKTGRPGKPLEKLMAGKSGFLREYIKGMHDIASQPAAEVAEGIDVPRAKTLLDVGGGPGTYTLAMLKKNRALRAVILDLPRTVKIAQKILRGHPYFKRIRFQRGNYHTADFGMNKYDLVIFSNVTHDEGEKENRRLLKKAFLSMKNGGQVIIHDFMLDETLSKPLFSTIFSVHMAVYTKKGRVYSGGEYSRWLREAGFKVRKSWKISAGPGTFSKAILAEKVTAP